MASELYYLTGTSGYNTYAQHWLANVLGTNAWGVSFIVGDGTTFPNCLQHQVANLAGAFNGSSGGTPILWGAVVEGPNGAATRGAVSGMIACPAKGTDTSAIFNGNDSGASGTAEFRDTMQSYSNSEPAIDLTASSFLAFSWRLAGTPQALP
jgi:endoglucanase